MQEKFQVTIRVVIIFFFFSSTLYSQPKKSLPENIQKKLDNFKSRGFSTSLEELNNKYTQPELKENSATIFLEAFSNHNRSEDEAMLNLLPILGHADMPDDDRELPPDMKKAMEEYLDKNKKALELLYKGISMRDCRFPLDFSKGYDMLLPHLSGVLDAVKLLCLQSLIYAERQQCDMAMKSIEACFQLTNTLMKEPVLISQLVRIAGISMTVKTLERIFSRNTLTEEQLDSLAKLLRALEEQKTLVIGYEGDICTIMKIYVEGKIPTELYGEKIDKTALFIYKMSGLWNSDFLTYLEVMEAIVETMHLPFRERIQRFNDIEKMIKSLPSKYIFSKMLLPSVGAIGIKEMESITKIRSLYLAVHVEKYRITNRGKLPDKLQSLVPKYMKSIPEDTFGGNPLKYKILAKGYLIYSIAEDEKDNDGAPRRANDGTRNEFWDIPFTVLR